ncbi:MAG: Fe-S cluster assembly protein HesB, partial [Actinobacteria bacterium]|nr:Fe-S cluster assembly protein HesB [Actinomycetota bacterium]
GSFRSVADVVDPDSLQKVRDFKKAAKAKASV